MVEAILRRMSKLRMFGRSPVGACLRLNEWIWSRLPPSLTALRPFRSLGHLLNSLVRLQDRRMYPGTFFLRNRPELELLRRLSGLGSGSRRVRIAVLGSSNGAEVYSIAWALRSARPDFKLEMRAVDISANVVEAAREGLYEPGVSELVNEPIFERMTAKEREEMFEREGDRFRIKPWVREGIVWEVGDAGDRKSVV
jgi:chemotaxis methyl-accepting protein methylase